MESGDAGGGPAPSAKAIDLVEETTEPLKGLVTRYYRLRSVGASTVRQVIEPWKSPQGRIIEVVQANLLVITDRPEHIDAIGRVLDRIDIQHAQVGIKARVVEIQNTDIFEYGFELRVDRNPVTKGSLQRIDGVLPPQSFLDTLLPGGQANTAPFAFQGSALTLNAVGHLFRELGDTELILRALEEEGYAKILSEPEIVVLSGEKASINALTRIPIEVTDIRSNVTTISTRYEDVGVKLEVTPTVIGTDSVELLIKPEVSSISGFVTRSQVGTVPIISTRSVLTRVHVRDRELLVMGGLYETRRVKKDRLIPGLGHLPLVGHLFRSTRSELIKTEIQFILEISILDQRPSSKKLRQPKRDRDK